MGGFSSTQAARMSAQRAARLAVPAPWWPANLWRLSLNERSPAGGPGYPGYWPNEVTGVLAPVIRAYLAGDELAAAEDIAVLRAYFVQWVDAPGFVGPEIAVLRLSARTLRSRHDIAVWLERALEAGIDPL
jgi:hypothetical protein